MTINKYKLLGAMRALHKSFTIDDLVRYSGLSENTVRTIMSREKQFYEIHARSATGRPGGKVSEYRVKPNALPELEAVMSQIYHSYPVSSEKTEPQAPLSLLAAEDILNRTINRTPRSADDKFQKSLHLVYLLIGDAGEELTALARTASDQTLFIPVSERLERLRSSFLETLGHTGLSITKFDPNPSVPVVQADFLMEVGH